MTFHCSFCKKSSAELHEVLPVLKLFKEKKPEKVLPTLKLFKDKKPKKKEIKTVSEQSQDELEPIISTPITSPMSDE